jgi:hypothetical protein
MDRFNQWLTLVANVGVIAGIVFLAYEIRLNTQAVTAETTTTYLENWLQGNLPVAEEPELASAVAKVAGADGFSALTPAESSQVASLFIVQLKAAEFAHYQYSQGLLDEELWWANAEGMYDYFSDFPAVRNFWISGNNTSFNKTFREFVDNMVADICSRQACVERPSFTAQNEARRAWLKRQKRSDIGD